MNFKSTMIQESLPSHFSPELSHNFDFQFRNKDRTFFHSSFKSYSLVDRETEPHVDNTESEFQFVSQNKPCIVIQNGLPSKSSYVKKKKDQKKQRKIRVSPRQIIQKQTRNVGSNLLRIFFKNILDLKTYESLIIKLLKGCQGVNHNQFYRWLESFNINYKNYIKVKEVKKIFQAKEPVQFKKMMLVLMRHHCDQKGLLHCLTSKRIEKGSSKMHVEGLRNMLEHFESLLTEENIEQ